MVRSTMVLSISRQLADSCNERAELCQGGRRFPVSGRRGPLAAPTRPIAMWRKLKKAAQLPASIEISGTLRDMDSAPESQFRGLLVKLSENLNAVENPKEFENVLELLKAQNVIGKLSALARADVTTISDPPLLHATRHDARGCACLTVAGHVHVHVHVHVVCM